MFSGLKRPVICVVGPTATGKSELGIDLALRIQGEVISADSMQVYRGMDIGTAKLLPDEMKGVRHHLIDVVDPGQSYSVAAWANAATEVIEDLHRAGKVPVVVGGTGLYIRAITEGLNFAGQSGSAKIRNKWLTFYEANGVDELHRALAEYDEASAIRIHPNDVRRTIRALELAELRDEPMSSDYDWSIRGGKYQTILLGIYMPREALYNRVNQRVDQMINHGLNAEVAGLLAAGYHADLTSMQAIGYKEMVAACHGDVSITEAASQIKQATRRFVKRQLSWFMRDPRIVWLKRSTLDANWINIDDVVDLTRRMAEGIFHSEGE